MEKGPLCAESELRWAVARPSLLILTGSRYSILTFDQFGAPDGLYQAFYGKNSWNLSVAWYSGSCVDVEDVRARKGAWW